MTTSSSRTDSSIRDTAGPDKHRVGYVGYNPHGAAALQRLAGLAERSGRIDEIVDHDAGLAFYRADDVHDLGHIRLRPAFVDDCQIGVV